MREAGLEILQDLSSLTVQRGCLLTLASRLMNLSDS
jgi:hypothetical protein